LVTTPDWSSTSAELRIIERRDDRWMIVTPVIPATVGRNGTSDDKVEGDGKAPAGIFRLSYAFGYVKPDSAEGIKLPYVQAHEHLVCVDDPESRFYNQMVSEDTLVNRDWASAERMLIDHQYKWGIVVDYNRPKSEPGRGSCIFLHVWKDPGHATSGCTAMSEENLLAILRRLDPDQKPLLLQLPVDEYNALRETAGLPELK
jgi:D-alanyl-D-alanine dipeptidase